MSETNLEQFREVTPAGRFTLQNSAMLKVRLENDQIQAKLGSMVAYQGDVRFEHKSGGLGRFFKKAVTGEGVKLMVAAGTGDLFLAQDKRKIMILDLENERMTVNGDNILAFEPGIDWDIKRVEGAGRLAGGLFNVVLEGTGKVAVTSDGEPVLLDPDLRRPGLRHSLERRRQDERKERRLLQDVHGPRQRRVVPDSVRGGRLGPRTTLGRPCRPRALPPRPGRQ